MSTALSARAAARRLPPTGGHHLLMKLARNLRLARHWGLGSCALILLGSCATRISAPGRIAADFGTIAAAKYIISNNVWGKSHSPGGRESVYCTGNASPVTWGATYDWPVGDKPYNVKAYPSIISGWHWGTWSAGSGLPVRVGDHRPVVTSASIAVTNPGVQNVAYDCWFHRIADPGNQSQPTDELMIWVARFGGAGPLGKLQGRVELGGATWDLYRGETSWNVFSFVRVDNAESWTIDVRDFVDYLVSVKGWLQPEKYLTSVQFGSEIFRTDGAGSFRVTDYRCDVR
jgi:hypothetical protein